VSLVLWKGAAMGRTCRIVDTGKSGNAQVVHEHLETDAMGGESWRPTDGTSELAREATKGALLALGWKQATGREPPDGFWL
jgi:hypothetical protein